MPYGVEPTETEAKQRIRLWIIDLLQRTGWQQVKLANDLGVSEPTISNIVKGKILPGFKILLRLHFRLGVHLNEVLRFGDEKRTTAHAPPQDQSRIRHK